VPTIPEIARRFGRHAASAGLAAGRAFETGYGEVVKPFEEFGEDIPQAEPFAPDTVSGGAIVAKTIKNIISGSRQNAINRDLRQKRTDAREMGELERSRLRQQIEAATLQDYTDPDTKETMKLTRSDIAHLMGRRATAKAIRERPARPAAQPDMSVRLERARKALDDRVERESDALVSEKDAAWADHMRQRVLSGDTSAADRLGIPRALLNNVNPETAYGLSFVVEKAIEGHMAKAKERRRLEVRSKYAQHYDAIEREIQQSGGLTQGEAPEPEGDPLLDEVLRRLDEEEAAPEDE
jgi:hypothetical protein